MISHLKIKIKKIRNTEGFQTRMFSSLQPVTTNPFGKIATDFTKSGCSKVASIAPVVKSHLIAFLSPETMMVSNR